MPYHANDEWWQAHIPGQRNEHRGWSIHYDPPPIAWRGADWQATHPDFDGPDDNRYVQSDSLNGVMAEIDAWIEAQSE